VTNDLEAKLIEDVKAGKEVPLERALLIISGLKTEEEIAKYTDKLDGIQEDFREYLETSKASTLHKIRLAAEKVIGLSKSEDYHIARFLFKHLWETKPNRHKLHSNFLLKGVVDAQLSEDKNQRVGNCLGLTSLYTVMGLREGLNLSTLRLDNHICSLLRDKNQAYVIENALPSGFNMRGFNLLMFLEKMGIVKCSVDYENSTEYSADHLVSGTYFNSGNVKYGLGDLQGAMEDYNNAIELDPEFSMAYNNRGIVKYGLGDSKGAMEDYDKTLELDRKSSLAYSNRGNVKKALGDLQGAMDDYKMAREINPEEFSDRLTPEIEKLQTIIEKNSR